MINTQTSDGWCAVMHAVPTSSPDLLTNARYLPPGGIWHSCWAAVFVDGEMPRDPSRWHSCSCGPVQLCLGCYIQWLV